MDHRIAKVNTSLADGTAAKNSKTCKVTLPTAWLETMAGTEEQREMERLWEELYMSKQYKILLGVCMLSALLFSGCAKNSTDGPAESVSSSEAISAASSVSSTPQISFEGTDLEGNTVSSNILSQSKLTMINVWATYCGPCLNEMPELGELAADYDGSEFQIIGIVSDVLEGEDQSLAEDLVRQTGANYTHLLLNESIYYALLADVSAVPTTFFLDENGTILGAVVGAQERSAWEEIIHVFLEKL